jgi:hypothetical protein
MKGLLIIALSLWSVPSWAWSPMTEAYFGGTVPIYAGYQLIYTDCQPPFGNVWYGSCLATPHESGGCAYYTSNIAYTITESFNYRPVFIMGEWVSNAAYQAALAYCLSKGGITQEEYNAVIAGGGRSWDAHGLLYMYYQYIVIDNVTRYYGAIRVVIQNVVENGGCVSGTRDTSFYYWWADGQPPVAPNAWIANLPEPVIDNEYTRKYGNSFNIYKLFLDFIKGLSNSSLFMDLPAFRKNDLADLGEGQSVIHVNLGNLGGQFTVNLAEWSTLYLIIRSIFLTCCMYYAIRLFINRVEE